MGWKWLAGLLKRTPKPVRRYARYDCYATRYDGVRCIECRCFANSIPAIKHHERCLTGRRESIRRDPPPVMPARKPQPFRPLPLKRGRGDA